MKQISFNKPHLTGKEAHYIYDAVYKQCHISGNGVYTKKCQQYFEERYGFKKTLMTTSCTDALEMAAILIDIKKGDEIIIPSYTFVSSANAFVLRGAKIVFADSMSENPNIDANKIEALITPKTKAIVVVHYGGIACDMVKIKQITQKYNLYLIEDAAQAIESNYKGAQLGSFGDLGAFSFHETKNINAGEGGLLIINNEKMIERAEIIWEKGTNRAQFFRGEINKYGWVDIGSSFLPSDIISAFLFAQLEHLEPIQTKRIANWNRYYHNLVALAKEGYFKLAKIPDYATNNAHLFYLLTKSLAERDELIKYLRINGIYAVFHYLPLHKSKFYLNQNEDKKLTNAEIYGNQLLRLPMYYELSLEEIDYICDKIKEFYQSQKNLIA